jgi:hypothetical protein
METLPSFPTLNQSAFNEGVVKGDDAIIGYALEAAFNDESHVEPIEQSVEGQGEDETIGALLSSQGSDI